MTDATMNTTTQPPHHHHDTTQPPSPPRQHNTTQPPSPPQHNHTPPQHNHTTTANTHQKHPHHHTITQSPSPHATKITQRAAQTHHHHEAASPLVAAASDNHRRRAFSLFLRFASVLGRPVSPSLPHFSSSSPSLPLSPRCTRWRELTTRETDLLQRLLHPWPSKATAAAPDNYLWKVCVRGCVRPG